jgi:hypothetical protein
MSKIDIINMNMATGRVNLQEHPSLIIDIVSYLKKNAVIIFGFAEKYTYHFQTFIKQNNGYLYIGIC